MSLDADLMSEMQADAGIQQTKDQDKLNRIEVVASQMRSTDRQIEALENRLKEAKEQRDELRFHTLPDLMLEAGLDRLGIPGDGIAPAVDLKLEAYYHANIAASWSPERRAAAFQWLEENGHGDLLKTTVSVQLGRGELKQAQYIAELLRGHDLDPEITQGVPWTTLTAWLKEQYEKYGVSPPLDLFGATIGQIVKIKPRKD